MKISIRQLEVLQTFSQKLNATETAKSLNITQSAVSQILKEVETYLGIKLFYRKSGKVLLTPEAQDILPDINRVLRDLFQLENHIEQVRGADAGLISVAGMSTVTSRLLPDAIAKFRTTRPQVRFRLEWLPTSDIIRHINDEAIDLGVTFGPVSDPGIVVEPLWRLPLVCVSPKGHRFGEMANVGIQDLQSEAVISSTPGTPAGMLMRANFDNALLARMTVAETNLSSATTNLVRQGVGVGLIHPIDFVKDDTEEFHITPVTPRIDLVVVMLSSRIRPRSLLVDRFAREVRQTIAEYAAALDSRNIPSQLLQQADE